MARQSGLGYLAACAERIPKLLLPSTRWWLPRMQLHRFPSAFKRGSASDSHPVAFWIGFLLVLSTKPYLHWWPMTNLASHTSMRRWSKPSQTQANEPAGFSIRKYRPAWCCSIHASTTSFKVFLPTVFLRNSQSCQGLMFVIRLQILQSKATSKRNGLCCLNTLKRRERPPSVKRS